MASTRDDFEELGCCCVAYILDTIARVDLSNVRPGNAYENIQQTVLYLYAEEIPMAQQRLHSIGVDIVGHLMWRLKRKNSSTCSAHSSPQGEDSRPAERLILADTVQEKSMEESEDRMMVSESSRDVESGIMDVSASGSATAAKHHAEQKRKGNTTSGMSIVREDTAEGAVETTTGETEHVAMEKVIAVDQEASTAASQDV